MNLPASPDTARLIRENWLRVHDQVAQACTRVGRDPAEVQIVGVAKYVDAALTAQLVDAGCQTIGENRPQVVWEKFAWFQEHQLTMPAWHLIGHFQRNKVRRTLPMLSMIEAVDSLRLAEELNQEAARIDQTIDVMIDVNVTQDNSKTGVTADQLRELAPQLMTLSHLRWRGLMAMSSLDGDEATVRAEFARVRNLRDQLQRELGSTVDLSQLSMGMSGDYSAAIAEGSTSVRIGSNLWAGIMTATH